MKFHEGLRWYWWIKTHLPREVCPHPFGLFECSNLFGSVLPKEESRIGSRTIEIAAEWCEGSHRLPEPGALCHLLFSSHLWIINWHHVGYPAPLGLLKVFGISRDFDLPARGT